MEAVADNTPKQEATGNKPGTMLHLSKEERLELQNLDLKRHVIETRAMSQLSQLEADQKALVEAVNKRIGDDMRTYRVDLDTGVMVKLTPEEIEKARRQNMPPVTLIENPPA